MDMNFIKSNFISATKEYNTLEKHVPAPYIRKSFYSDCKCDAKIVIACCGFYEFYINGTRYTKGRLAPYICNTDDYIYYDEYTVPVDQGENVFAVILGNGFQNNPGGYVWDFDKASYRSVPMISAVITYKDNGGNDVTLVTDTTFKTHPSPIIFDDYRFGEYYDANKEMAGWNLKGFDDSLWQNVIDATPPKGEVKLCKADPVVEDIIIEPTEIIKVEDGYIYDFGTSHAGVCKITVDGKKGQTITLQHTDSLKDGDINVAQVWFVNAGHWDRDKEIVHKDILICKDGLNEYQPTFTYHGFRYVKVTGITESQATKDLLKYVTIHSDVKVEGGFECDNEMVNILQETCVKSAISNFHYFPTDCPQREKNGWTADAALSMEFFILNLYSHKSYKEWMYNIIKSQDESGEIPGIVPSGGWGFGEGPAWDCIIAYVPYYLYVYYGETELIKESADALIKYLKFLVGKADERGLINYGLCDWCPVGRVFNEPESPLEVTSTLMSIDIAQKMAFLFDVIGKTKERDYAQSVAQKFKKAFRDNLIDFDTMMVAGNCQTSQSMAINLDIFEQDEKEKAFKNLVEIIHNQDDSLSTGVIGARFVFHVLAQNGEWDLAYKMITKPEFPSYAALINMGATTLWEGFCKGGLGAGSSKNHHFWGDISGWFIKRIAGILYNPSGTNLKEVTIKPSFVSDLNYAKGYYTTPYGKVVSQWNRDEKNILINLQIPSGITATFVCPMGYALQNGDTDIQLKGDAQITVVVQK